MAITRRQFIKRTGLVAAGSFLGAVRRSPLLHAALADTIGDRYFVVVFLDGGNDGLNTVSPIDDGSFGTLRAAYEAARTTGSGGLQLSAAELTPMAVGNDPGTGTPLALHPGLIGLKNLFDLGTVAVIQGCGYPDYSLSHEVSRRTWQSAAGGGSGTGWMGRYLAANYGSGDIPAISLRNEVAGEFIQSSTSVLALRRLNRFGFPYDQAYPDDVAAKAAAFQSLSALAAASAQPTRGYAGTTAGATLSAATSYPPLAPQYQHDRASYNQAYADLNTGFARDLREVAKVIYGVERGVPNVHARFFELRNGGYDTHSNQGAGAAGSQHYRLHREVGDALELFYADCADMGVANKLCVLVWSEFSRRVAQNDNGTDHGSQGPMFVIGGAVNGGVYGQHPNISSGALNGDGNTVYSQAAGDPYRSTDFRDVYGTVLKHWLNMPETTILSDVLPPDLGNATDYWTSPNFDLGFI